MMRMVPFTLLFALVATAAAPLPLQPDKGFVTDTHKAMVGNIVFAKSGQAVTTPEKPDQFVDQFTAKDSVFLRAYLPHSLNNAFRAQGVDCTDALRTWTISVDGKTIGLSERESYFFAEPLEPTAAQQSTSVRYDKALNAAPDGDQSIWRSFAEVVAPKLQAGTHQLTLSVGGQCMDKLASLQHKTLEQPLAVGSFNYVVDKASVVSVMPKPAKSDKKLEAEMKAAIEDKWRGEKVLKLVIVDKDWAVETIRIKNTDVPQRRVLHTQAAVQQAKGCRIFEVSFEQPAKSMKTFGPTAFNAVGASHVVDCGAVQ